MTSRAFPQGMPGKIHAAVAIVLFRWVDRRLGNRHAEQIAAVSKLLRAMAIAEEAVIADAMEALGQDVKQEAADELVGRDSHDLLPMAVPIVRPAETNGASAATLAADLAGENPAGGIVQLPP